MDFLHINYEVTKYLDKQREALLHNPREINVIILRLENYAVIFHNELREMFEHDNFPIDLTIEEDLAKPLFEQVRLDRLNNVEQVRKKLFSLSSQMNAEFEDLQRKQKDIFRSEAEWIRSVHRFKKSIRGILNTEIIRLQHNDTLLYRIGEAIKDELRQWKHPGSLPKLFNNVYHDEVVNELTVNSTENIDLLCERIFKTYKTYFEDCLRKYEEYYNDQYGLRHLEVEVLAEEKTLQLHDEVLTEAIQKVREPEILSELQMNQQVYVQEIGKVENMQDDTAILASQNIIKIEELETNIVSVTLHLLNGKKETLDLNTLDESLRLEWEITLSKVRNSYKMYAKQN